MPLGHLCSTTDEKRLASPSTIKEFYDVQLPLPNQMERCPSNTSILSYSKDICRICHCEGDEESPMIAPCFCAGSLRYVHQTCLQQWIKSSNTKNCELCKFRFIMNTKLKPLNKWEILDLSWIERRKILCSVSFHAMAIFCVVWSLFVLIQRSQLEVKIGSPLEWPFWTKLIVVAIGISGSAVFMYVQCKMYYQLCCRWKAYNRVIYVQNAPEKVIVDDPKKGIINTMQKDQFDVPQKNRFSIDCPNNLFAVTVVNDRIPQRPRRARTPDWPLQTPIECKEGPSSEPELETLIPMELGDTQNLSMARNSSPSNTSGPPEDIFGAQTGPFRSPIATEILEGCKHTDDISDSSEMETLQLGNE